MSGYDHHSHGPGARALGRHVLFCMLALAAVGLALAGPARAGAPVGPPASPLTLIAIDQARLAASDGGTDDHFGISVDVDGDTALVGAHYWWGPQYLNRGAAYVFVRSGATWVQQAKLVSDRLENPHTNSFGFCVALSGDTAFVGAPTDGDVPLNQSSRGSVYVFTRSGTSWSEQAKLTPSFGEASDEFGISVALDGDTALVGAHLSIVDRHVNAGAAYVFMRTGSTWSEEAKLTASDGDDDDFFGARVALSGDTCLVGAHEDDIGDNQDQGSAYVFARSGSTWVEQAKLSPQDGDTYDNLGESVAISGDTAVIASSVAGPGISASHGSAYIYTRSGTLWVLQQKLTVDDEEFGAAVAISGDIVLVGTAVFGYVPAGDLVYVFKRSGARWAQQTVLHGATHEGDFGESLAIEGQTVIVGSPMAEFDLDHPRQGAARVFNLDVDTIRPTTTAYAAIVAKGRNVKLRYRVNDRAPSCGQARVVLRIMKGAKVKRAIRVPKVRPCNVRLSYRWKCTLPKGVYTLKVYATDVDGNVQSKVGSARLTVK
jgi:FG-GAP repeat